MNRSGTGTAAAGAKPAESPGGGSGSKSGKQGTVNNQTAGSLPNTMVTTTESIKCIAESIGVSNINEEASKELALDLTFIVKSILVDAQKFARRSRRKRIIPSDIDYSLKARSLEPIYGFNSVDQVPYRCATSTGGNGSGRAVFYTEDHVVDLIDLIATNNQTVKIPNDFAIHAHWLAIEGIQPSVPENPQIITKEMQKREAIEGLSNKPKEALKQQQNHQKRTESLVKLKSLIPHDLSVEQQIYFKEITEACVGSDEQKRTEALNSLSTDPGLHQLLPRIILFISEGVRLNIIQQNMAILIYLMRMAKSLSENKSIYLEKYLHELLPSVLSCVLSKQVCARPEVENHCALREFCARLIGQIVKTYSPTIPSLQTRTIKIYLNSLESETTTFATLFGAISGLTELGNDICESFIFPLIKMVGERITQILDSPASQLEKLPADKVKQQIIRSVSSILKQRQVANEYDHLMDEFGAYFGPMIHAQLMKLRGTQQTMSQAQLASAASQQSRVVVTPQFNRTQNTTHSPQSNTSTPRTNQISQQSTHSNQNLINQLDSVEVISSTIQSTLNQTNVTNTQITAQSPSSTAKVNLTSTSSFPLPVDSQKDSNAPFSSKTINSSSTTFTNGSQMIDLKLTDANCDFTKTNSVLMSIDQNDNINSTISTEIQPTDTSSRIDNNPNNLSNLTSDSNNTNNMTTSDVNLSDTMENQNDPLG